MELTKLEVQVLEVFYNESVESCGDCSSNQNLSYNNAQDVATQLNLSENTIGGVFTSLLKKGLISDTRDSARRAPINDFVVNNNFFGEDGEVAPEIAKLLNIQEVA